MSVLRRLVAIGWLLGLGSALALLVGPVWLAPQAWASGTIALSGPTVSPGETVTVTGSGWAVNTPVNLYLDGSDFSYPATSTTLPAAMAEGNGDLRTTFVIPAQSIGSFHVRACQSCDLDAQRAALTVVPGLRLAAVQVKAGERVGLSGSGWPYQAGDVYLFADPADRGDPSKAFAHLPPSELWQLQTQFTVPELPVGRHEIFACQWCDGRSVEPRAVARLAAEPGFDLSAHASYTIVPPAAASPSLALTPSQGAARDQIVASGSGWDAAAGPVWIFAHRRDVVSTVNALVSATPSTRGRVHVSFPAPALDEGKHVFYACQICTGRRARLASHAFVTLASSALNPTLEVNPASAKSGATVTVNGVGWDLADGEISIFADRSLRFDARAALLTVQPSIDGTFQAALVVPSLAAGSHQLFACQACTELAGFPSAAQVLTIEKSASTLPLLLVGLAIATLVATAVALWWIRRPRSPRPGRAHSQQSPRLEPPHFEVRPGDQATVTVHPPEGPRPPSLRLVPRPDESPEVSRVEVPR
jgi:hypothetical protein